MKTKFSTWLLIGTLCATFACSSKKEQDGTTTTGASTVPLNIRKVALGGNGTSFAIDANQVLKSWGRNYDADDGLNGLLGTNVATNTDSTTPQTVDAGTQFTSVSAGEYTNCAMTSSRRIKCWGRATGDGSVGNSGSGNSTVPVYINDDGALYSDVAAGSYHACAVTQEGVARCWGDGWDGKLGDGTTNGADSPITADSGTLYSRIAAGRNHTCGITTAGVLKCWGSNDVGQLGLGSLALASSNPVIVDAGVTYAFIAAAQNTTCGITTAGVLKCWGANSHGQLGDGTILNRAGPVVAHSGTLFTEVSLATSSGNHACARTTSNALRCWGENASGQLGDSSTTADHLSAYATDSAVAYSAIAAGFDHVCGITTTGSLKCWGENSTGALGLGDTTSRSVPSLVSTGF